MADEIPFTTGALRDWPLIEEIIDRLLDQAADRAGRTDFGDEYRQEVIENVRRAYEAMNHSISLTVSLPPLPVGPAVADEIRRNIEDACF